MTRRCVVPALLLTFLILLAVPALAQVQPIEGCTVIDKPGSYALANNITATESSVQTLNGVTACIVIAADFVTLDLRGYTITGLGEWPNGIETASDASGKWPNATHIRNGIVTKFWTGLSLPNTGITIDQMRLVANGGNGIGCGANAKIENVVVSDNGMSPGNGMGIICWGGTGSSVRNSQVYSNNANGIDMSACPGSSIVGNTVSQNAGVGIAATCPSVVLQNVAYQNGLGNIVIPGPPRPSCTRSDNNPAP